VTLDDPFAAAWAVVLDGSARDACAGAVALVLHRRGVVLPAATGWACREPERIPMTVETVFDLTSLTKVVATLPCILQLVALGELDLETPVRTVLPPLRAAPWSGRVTVRQLLSHTSGLPAWLPLYLRAHSPDEYLVAIAQTELVAPPGTQVIYSDLGFILLDEIVRSLTGHDIATLARREVFAPLSMHATCFRPPPDLRPRSAATERGNAFERSRAGPPGARYTRWREAVIWGEVHDGNAFYGLEGIAGHAGLFAPADELARFAQFWLDHGRWEGRQLFPSSLVSEATRPQGPGRGLGWMLAFSGTAAARGLHPTAYGHTGFTGTSLWIDPERELVIILLTNRVHPVVRAGIEAVRAAFTEAVARAAREVG
jgi:CubicO group peptidase (beta-lactamase class C family)